MCLVSRAEAREVMANMSALVTGWGVTGDDNPGLSQVAILKLLICIKLESLKTNF